MMRRDIRNVILDYLRKHGQQTTVEIQGAIVASGLPQSGHRYPTVRKYLVGMAEAGEIRLVRESEPGEGGGIWSGIA